MGSEDIDEDKARKGSLPVRFWKRKDMEMTRVSRGRGKVYLRGTLSNTSINFTFLS